MRKTTNKTITKRDYIRWGIAAKFYGFMGRLFRSVKLVDKSVVYLDKRWEYLMNKPL